MVHVTIIILYILAIEMDSRNFSLDEVLPLMEHEEDLEIDDPQEVILGGSEPVTRSLTTWKT